MCIRDRFMVDVTDIPSQLFDEVTLLGRDGKEEITLDVYKRQDHVHA